MSAPAVCPRFSADVRLQERSQADRRRRCRGYSPGPPGHSPGLQDRRKTGSMSGVSSESEAMTESERQVLHQILPRAGWLVSAEVGPAAGGDPVGEMISASRPKMDRVRVSPGRPLPEFCKAQGIRRVALLDLGPAGSDIRLMRSAVEMIRAGRIDIIRFDYRHAQKQGETISDAFCFLRPLGFTFLRFSESGASIADNLVLQTEAWTPHVYLAFAPRLRSLLVPDAARRNDESLIDIPARFSSERLTPRGVIHVGAHHGEELPLYKRMGFRPILFIEANPDLAAALRQKTSGDPDVIVVNCAASDADGETTLRITSNDLSSSILPLKMHREYYPSIDESRQVTVRARRVDSLLAELKLDPARFNFLHLDIQGAELMALRGAKDTLGHIEALVTEVNFEELYEGCGLFDDLDEYLRAGGFVPSTITCPFHSSWGDAFYSRKVPAGPAPAAAPTGNAGLFTLSSIGHNGRFGNQLYQYAFARMIADHHGLKLMTSPWLGQHLFGIRNPPVTQRLPRIHESREFPEGIVPLELFEQCPANHDIWGFFQFDTIHYAPYKDFIRSLYRPIPTIENPLRAALLRLTAGTRPLVALHIRRGDFVGRQFFSAPTAWYRTLLESLWPTLNNPLLYVASDEPGLVLPELSDFAPITQQHLDLTVRGAEHYLDFYILSQADVLAISNSSYSFFAGLLNERAKAFYRPHLYQQQLIAYEPWNSPPILHRELGEPLNRVLDRAEKRRLEAEASPAHIQIEGSNKRGSTFITFHPRSGSGNRPA